jgi:hypothetical protein
MSFKAVSSPFTALLAAVLALSLTPAVAGNETPASDEVVVLPALNIKATQDLSPPEPWSYARVTGFDVLSSASDRETRRLLRDFEIFRLALSIAWPVPQREVSGAVLILCGRDNRFGQFLPPDRSRKESAAASLFLRDREQAAIVLDLVTSISLFDAGRNADEDITTTQFQVDAYRQLYREYVRFLLSNGDSHPPAWLAEGMSQIVMHMEFTDRWVTFGELEKFDGPIYQPRAGLEFLATPAPGEEAGDDQLVAPWTTVRDGTFNISLRRRALMPLAEMFAVNRDSPEARNPLGNNRWAQQCYAFVHMCLYGDRKRWQQPFADFIQRTSGREPTEAEFTECFGMNYRQMLTRLRGYISYTNYQYERFKLKGGDRLDMPAPAVREATEGEIGRIKGDALRLAGHADAARNAYQDAYRRGARDPALLAALGMEESRAGRDERARAFLEAAFAAGDAARPVAWFELALLRFKEARAQPAGALGRLSSSQVMDIIAPLARAQQHPPLLPEIFGLAATVWNLSEVQATTEQLRALDTGVARFPGYSDMIFNVARLNYEAGDVGHALLVAKVGAENAKDPKSRARFEGLLARLSPQPDPEAASGSPP